MSLSSSIERACSVFCEGSILHHVQMAQLFNDSKEFVDRPMKVDPEVISLEFDRISDKDKLNSTILSAFVDKYFHEVGQDELTWIPTDIQESPDFLDNVADDYRSWASSLNQLWSVLGVKVQDSVSKNPQRSSFIPRKFPMIVPGGRFRESYYWDSFFILRGLLVCDMPNTASSVLNNFLEDLNNFGFIPNGARVYYLDRSQPPLASEMVLSMLKYYGAESTEGKELLLKAYPLLEKEMNFWMSDENKHVINFEQDGVEHTLNIYHSSGKSPRPESYYEDVTAAESLRTEKEIENAAALYPNSSSAQDLYFNLRTGGESGWDFSTRWIDPVYNATTKKKQYDLNRIETGSVIPVDLNSILYRMELNLFNMGKMVGSTDYQKYKTAAEKRKRSINAVMWNDELQRWMDLDSTNMEHIINHIDDDNVENVSPQASVESYISSFSAPLWAGLLPHETTISAVVDSLHRSALIQEGGVLTSTVQGAGQQWDSPNAWPPLMLMLIEGLRTSAISSSSASATALSLSDELASTWLKTNYLAYSNSSFMYEKYNAFELGTGGGGGEYIPQVGFGWTNGVALVLLQNSGEKKVD